MTQFSDKDISCAAWHLLDYIVTQMLEEPVVIRNGLVGYDTAITSDVVAQARYLWPRIEASLKPAVCEDTQK